MSGKKSLPIESQNTERRLENPAKVGDKKILDELHADCLFKSICNN
jgi:hypothetical protein